MFNNNTVLTRPNLTESRPQPNLRLAFCVHSGSALGVLWWTHCRADPNQTQSGHRKQALISEADP